MNMDHKTKLDQAADAILAVMERHAEHLPRLERDAKWHAFSREVAKIGTPAKPQERPESRPRPVRKHASH